MSNPVRFSTGYPNPTIDPQYLFRLRISIQQNLKHAKAVAAEHLKKESYIQALEIYNNQLEEVRKTLVWFPDHINDVPPLLTNRSLVYIKLNLLSSALRDADECLQNFPLWKKGYLRKYQALICISDVRAKYDALKCLVNGLNFTFGPGNYDEKYHVVFLTEIAKIIPSLQDDPENLLWQIRPPTKNSNFVVKMLEEMVASEHWEGVNVIVIAAHKGPSSCLDGIGDKLGKNVPVGTILKLPGNDLKGWELKLCATLIRNGSPVKNIETVHDHPPVHIGVSIALETEFTDLLESIIDVIGEEDLNARNSKNESALHLVLKSKKVTTPLGETLLTLLLNHGCHIDLLDAKNYLKPSDPHYHLLVKAEKKMVGRPSSSGSSYNQWRSKVYKDDMWRKKPFVKSKRRHWEWTKLGLELGINHGAKPKEGFTFSVMSYNILAQHLLERNMFLYDDNGFLHWDHRKHAIMREIQALSPEIVCLQEVNEKHYRNFLLPEMSRLGFEGIYKKREDEKDDGCAIFYARDQFLPEVITPLSLTKEGSILNKANVAIVVKLKVLKTGELICVANTHLLYNPKRGDIKLGQLMILLAEIDKLAVDDKHYYIPTILCGDFNSEPFSDIYNFIQTGMLQYEGLNIRKMSGQRTGSSGMDKFLAKNFLPMSINISDSCQYVDVANNRIQFLSRHVQNQTVTVSQKVSAIPLKFCFLQNYGSISHKMNFVSVYNHFQTERESGLWLPEVSTHHRSGSATVDYLFYNVLQKNLKQKRWGTDVVDIKEGSLKLLGKLQLLTSKDLIQTGFLPNEYYPSDHLPLVAKFWIV